MEISVSGGRSKGPTEKQIFAFDIYVCSNISKELLFLHKTSNFKQSSLKESHQLELPVCILKKLQCSF